GRRFGALGFAFGAEAGLHDSEQASRKTRATGFQKRRTEALLSRIIPIVQPRTRKDGAVEKTRTSTAFRPQRPQRCASTSSATTARHKKGRLDHAAGTGKARPVAKAPQGRNAARPGPDPIHNGTILKGSFTICARPR